MIEGGARGAIFGHTHRAKYKSYKNNLEVSEVLTLPIRTKVCFDLNEKFLVTNGSLGQPRGSISSFLICDIDSNNVSLQSVPIEYDIAMHCESINQSSLTEETKEKLLKYYN